MQSANTAAAQTTAPVAPRDTPLGTAPSPAFLERFLNAAQAKVDRAQPSNELCFEHFMRLALYDEKLGYYAQPNRTRVGRSPRTDFYTATSVGQNPSNTNAPASPSLFGELVVQGCLTLMGKAFCARATFVEIGAEPNGGVLHSLAHPFAAARTISLGQPILLSAENDAPLIVFSNELFDAQPCRRFVWRDVSNAQRGTHAFGTGWCETYVRAENGTLSEVEHPLERVPKFLPKTASNGYRIDAPIDAKALLDQIAQQRWHGLFLAFDYGKTWAELAEATPQGTARAYTHHRQTNDLLAQPGQQDLTCHICWDWLQES